MYRDAPQVLIDSIDACVQCGDDDCNLSLEFWIVESVNTTSKSSLKRRMNRSGAHVLLVQETGVVDSEIDDFVFYARIRGWHCSRQTIAAVKVCGGGKTSSGSIVLVREGIGIAGLLHPLAIRSDGRLATAIVEFLGWKKLLVGSTYLITGDAMGAANRAILSQFGRCVEDAGLVSLIAGDFQNSVSVVKSTSWHRLWGAKGLVPSEGTATCVTGSSSSQIDFGFANGPLTSVDVRVSVVFDSDNPTHRPVQFHIPKRAAEAKKLVFSQPSPIPVQRVFGPINRGPDWTEALQTAESAVDAAASLPASEALYALDRAYFDFAVTAEQQLAVATDTQPSVWGLRARPLKARWVSAFAGKHDQSNLYEKRVEAWRCIGDRVHQLRREEAALLGGASWEDTFICEHCVDAQTLQWDSDVCDDLLDRYTASYKNMCAALMSLIVGNAGGSLNPDSWCAEMELLDDELSSDRADVLEQDSRDFFTAVE